MRATLRELCDPAGLDDLWDRKWWDKCRRLQKALDVAEARAQKRELRRLDEEWQIRRWNHLLYMLVHWPSAWEELTDSGSLTISCHSVEWAESFYTLPAIPSDDLEETVQETFREAMADLEDLGPSPGCRKRAGSRRRGGMWQNGRTAEGTGRSRFRLAADVRELSAFVRICPRSKSFAAPCPRSHVRGSIGNR